ncbi:BspA family leucine-rich repeat surface protein [Bifidobacterium sp. ESL0769]|uniref:BspA family leucine-rich repeat surface protein n=1 Tax=Bifidobacterium sp. ESL0769 TaxID=2983229 RepID=UPI0023F7884E|nr:BspA family leucine-rich repeat surface protein [Bifidobacterium sp. ESL0769]WEV67106.1 BspA family leucine-rich repeat surface protein [Bifidobacterium sp. ESL0769]
MALGTGVVASADSANTPTGSSSTVSQTSQSSDVASADTSKSAEANTDLKQSESPVVSASSQPEAGKVAAPKKTESEQAQQISGAKTEQKTQAPLTRSQQQPEAQGDPDPSIKAQGDWGGNENGTEKVHWYVQETAPNKEVLHFGSGVLGSYVNEPSVVLDHSENGKQLHNNIVRIVFDDATNTHFVPKTDFDCQGYPNLESIDHVDDLDFSRLEGQTGNLKLGAFFGSDPKLKSVDLTGWGTKRTAPGAGLPGTKASSKWKTGVSINMGAMFEQDLALTTISGLDDWDTSAVTDTSYMFRTDYQGGSVLDSIGDLSRWDMSNNTNVRDMFESNPKLLSVGDLSGWNLSHAKCAEWMFLDTGISSVGNVSHWGMGQVTDMQGIFANMPNLTEVPGIKNWDVSKNTWFTCFFQDDYALKSLDLTGWSTDAATDMLNMFFDDYSLTQVSGLTGFKTGKVTSMDAMFYIDSDHSGLLTSLDMSGWDTSSVKDMDSMFSRQGQLAQIKGLSDWNVSSVTDIDDIFNGDFAFTTIDLSGWDTHAVTSGTYAFPYGMKSLKLGPRTKIADSFFGFTPDAGGATEDNGYTGRWTKSDNTWTSDASDDNHALAALTQDSGFEGGTYVWQEFAEVSFRKNAPKHAKVSGSPVTIRKVGAKAEDIKIKVPRLMFHAKNYKFLGWNSGKHGGQMSFKRGDTVTNFNRGENIRLWAQWQSKGVPSTPLIPSALEYRIHYEANAPEGLTATGSVPDDVFTVNPASGVDLLHYGHQVTKKEFKVEGYKLLTWATRKDMHGGFYGAGSTIRVAPGTTTLYAVWAKDATVISTPTTSAKPVAPATPTTPTSPEMPTRPTNPTTPIRPTVPTTPTNPTTPRVPTAPTQNQASQNVTNNGRNAVPRQSALVPVVALPVAAPAFAPAQRVAGNAVAPAPAAGSDGVASVPQQQRPRPKCIPEDVYQKMKSGKRGNEPVYWIEPDGSAYVQSSAWSLSDYNGLPQCSIGASAPAPGMHTSFNFWWLLVFLVPLFLLLFAYRNNDYILARHRNLDSANI